VPSARAGIVAALARHDNHAALCDDRGAGGERLSLREVPAAIGLA